MLFENIFTFQFVILTIFSPKNTFIVDFNESPRNLIISKVVLQKIHSLPAFLKFLNQYMAT